MPAAPLHVITKDPQLICRKSFTKGKSFAITAPAGRAWTPARPAAARMQATAAYMAYCQKSSDCHEATSSSRSGSVPPWTAAAAPRDAPRKVDIARTGLGIEEICFDFVA